MHFEAGLGPAKRRFNTSRRCSAGEDEPQIAAAFGKRDHRPAPSDRYLQTDYPFDRERLLLTRDMI